MFARAAVARAIVTPERFAHCLIVADAIPVRREASAPPCSR
jgi:hypothetical protein